jgi:D-beta-D-heptose 7-phosphate kinase/D-beta-D-heptose 1-phosphate adenosyltransferase
MKRIVVNGTFDTLHLGHVRLLAFANSLGKVLVLIDSDRRVRELKGENRPINNETERSYILSSLKFVDRVEIFNSDQELIDLIKNYHPDIMVKGSDYVNQPIIGAEYCKKIEFYGRIPGYSTTEKIQSIIDRG